jgi:pentapeptide repeat protein
LNFLLAILQAVTGEIGRMNVTPTDDESATVAATTRENERAALELEKLRLDVETARVTKGLEADKLRLEIRQIERATGWWHISTFVPLFVGLATLIAGLILNHTLNYAADEQHAFENYTKLTDEFSKGGSAKLGAIVGFRPFLRPWADRSDQTVELLANELLKEQDPTTRRAIVQDLVFAGMPAFNHVRDVNIVTREKLRKAAIQLMFRYANADKAHTVPCPSCNVYMVSGEARNAAGRYAPDLPQTVQQVYRDWLSQLVYAELGDWGPVGVNEESSQPWEQARREFDAQAPAFLASVDVLRALLWQPGADLKNFDASGIAVFDMDFRDADLQGINFSGSIIEGSANGADLSNADLSNANLRADLSRSVARSTSLCGANVLYAKLKLSSRAELPNLIAANWWDIIDDLNGSRVPRNTRGLEATFPRGRNEPFAALQPEAKKHLCAKMSFTQGGSAGPDASFRKFASPMR